MKVLVSGIYWDDIYKQRRAFKRGKKFVSSWSYLGPSFWVEIKRYDSEPDLDQSIIDEIEKFLED